MDVTPRERRTVLRSSARRGAGPARSTSRVQTVHDQPGRGSHVHEAMANDRAAVRVSREGDVPKFQARRGIVRTQDPDRLGHEDDATRGRGGGERSSRGLARGRCGPVCSSVRGPRRSSSCWFPPSKFEQQNGSGSFRAPVGHIPGNAASRQTRLAESSGPTPTFPVSR